MTEYEKAKVWRQSLNLTQKALGEALGYSRESINSFESGMMPHGARDRRIKPWVWQRYRLACFGLDTLLRDKAPNGWDWNVGAE